MADGVTLFLDEYNPDLAVERGVFVMAGVLVRSGAHQTRAAGDFSSLAAGDARFDRKARKWEAEQFGVFAEYLLGHEVLPVAWRIALNPPLVAEIRRCVAAGFPPRRDRAMRPTQWILCHGVTQTLASASVAWLLRNGQVTSLDVVIDRGNFAIWQQETLADVVGLWSGPYAIEAVRRRTPDMPDDYLAELHGLGVWRAPSLQVEARGPMLAVADAYTSLVARALAGEVRARSALESLRASYRYRHSGLDAHFLCKDGTDGVKRDLAAGWPLR